MSDTATIIVGLIGFLFVFFIFPNIMNAAFDKADKETSEGNSGCLGAILVVVIIVVVVGCISQLKDCTNHSLDLKSEPRHTYLQKPIKNNVNKGILIVDNLHSI